jgi:hypothetical protein
MFGLNNKTSRKCKQVEIYVAYLMVLVTLWQVVFQTFLANETSSTESAGKHG